MTGAERTRGVSGSGFRGVSGWSQQQQTLEATRVVWFCYYDEITRGRLLYKEKAHKPKT